MSHQACNFDDLVAYQATALSAEDNMLARWSTAHFPQLNWNGTNIFLPVSSSDLTETTQ